MGKEAKTNAIRTLEQKGATFTALTFETDCAVSGTEVAEILNLDPADVFKTLVTVGKSQAHYVFLIPVAEELDLKKCAAAVGEKNIEMLKSKDLLPLTGYVHGGCSPIGMKKFFKTTIDSSASTRSRIVFSGGRIGLQVVTTLESLGKVIPFTLADITK